MANGIDVFKEIGDLRHPLQYQARTAVGRDTYGHATSTPATTQVIQGSIKQLSGRESMNADRLQIVATHVIRTRYFPGATAQGRFLFNGAIFGIKTVDNVDQLNIMYEFMVEQVGNPPS